VKGGTTTHKRMGGADRISAPPPPITLGSNSRVRSEETPKKRGREPRGQIVSTGTKIEPPKGGSVIPRFANLAPIL
jgi:hypothetical protein